MRVRLVDTTAFRLAMGYAVFFCVLVTLCLGFAYWLTASELDVQIDGGLRAEMEALTGLYQVKGLPALQSAVAARSSLSSLAASDTGDAGPRQYLLVDPSLKPLAGTLTLWPAQADPPLLRTMDLDLPPDQPGLDHDGPRVHVRVDAIRLADGSRLLIGQTLNETDELRYTLLGTLIGAVLLTLLASIVGGVYIGHGVVQRMRQVTLAADNIMAGDLSRRIPTGPQRDEFGALAEKLNAMLSRIEELMRHSREVTENVAHDLRSPLSRLRGRLEALQHAGGLEVEALQSSIDETDRVVTILNSILTIAEIGASSRVVWDRLDAAELCRGVVDLYRPLAEEKQTVLAVNLEAGLYVFGNRQLLARALSNLLDNAIKYTPAGGRIQLELAQSDGGARISVADSGPGIPADMRGRVLERFVRLDQSRSLPGNGLGLSLVAAVAAHHGTRLDLEDNGPGLRVTLELTGEDSRS